MRNLIYLPVTLLIFTSCSTMKGTAVRNTVPSQESADPRFIETITISPVKTSTVVRNPSYRVAKPLPVPETIGSDIENVKLLQFKYSILTNTPVEYLTNEKLLNFLDSWYGTPYRYGGNTKAGVDCSAFTNFLMTDVYGVNIPRNSRDQFEICKPIDRNELQEGDLVFFKNRGRISHVGVYLGNQKFAHASTSSGVMISDLGEDYFSRRFAGSGRILP